MKKNGFFLLASLSLLSLSQLRSQSVTIVAAENFYGGVAAKVVGSSANVTSIMSNPNQDPHEFQTDAETAKAALAVFPNNDWRQALEALADFSVSRAA
jgi:zinc/manganese transport system substrate-binding protein